MGPALREMSPRAVPMHDRLMQAALVGFVNDIEMIRDAETQQLRRQKQHNDDIGQKHKSLKKLTALQR